MAYIYARLIKKGKKTIDDVPDTPDTLKDQVRQALSELGE